MNMIRLSRKRCVHFSISCAILAVTAQTSSAKEPPAALETELTTRITATAKTGDVPGIVISVAIPRRNVSIQYASGKLERSAAGASASEALPTSMVLQASDEFRIASVTKTYTAAAILRLVEMRKITLDGAISRFISPESVAELKADGYDPAAITVRQLLSHSSGIYDYATDPQYLAAIAENPGRLWTLREQVQHAMKHGAPLAKPGLVYSYSDTGYALLSEILSRSTQLSFGDALSKLLGFERLGLKHTYLEVAREGIVETLPPRRIHQYQDDIDTTRLNPSFDLYGGGGLVSTTPDIVRFFQALFARRVFDRPTTLKLMLMIKPGIATDRGTEAYALGIRPMRYGKAKCWGHVGHWGIIAGTCPSLDMTFAYAGNAAGEKGYAALSQVTKALSDYTLAIDRVSTK
jgi:D-alanyl-D-alanine carboxypeptidase